jgi:hypothetical protein
MSQRMRVVVLADHDARWLVDFLCATQVDDPNTASTVRHALYASLGKGSTEANRVARSVLNAALTDIGSGVRDTEQEHKR